MEMTSKTWCETYPEREADDPCTYCHHQDLCDELEDLEICIWEEIDGWESQDIEHETVLTLFVRSHVTMNMSIKRFRIKSAFEEYNGVKE
jgi:hypothetical protein